MTMPHHARDLLPVIALLGIFAMPADGAERQITNAPHGHILTNVGVWSHDGRWLAYDVRSDPAGSVFDGDRIERVEVDTGKVEVLYTSKNGARCGVATCSPVDDRVAFILGPENPTPDWTYGMDRRQGVIVRASRPGPAEPLDARDLAPPFTPGALRGGSHVHVFSGDGKWISFTYEDYIVNQLGPDGPHDRNQRTIGVSAPFGPVRVGPDHPRNHDGTHFTAVVARTVNKPKINSEEIDRAFEDAWIGADGYTRPDGTRVEKALAFLGNVRGPDDRSITELFALDLPADPRTPGDGPLEGTATTRPLPPRGTSQRRLTVTADRRHPGLPVVPRFWPRSAPDGSQIAFLLRDDAGIVQLAVVSPNGGPIRQVTRIAEGPGVSSAFTWTPDGRSIAHALNHQVCLTDASTGRTTPLTPPHDDLRPEAVVVSPDGRRIAYVRHVAGFNQVFVCGVKEKRD